MNAESLSVVLAGGGTAGHISPLLAIAAALRDVRPDVRLLAEKPELSGGLALPIVAHVAADATIYGILAYAGAV